MCFGCTSQSSCYVDITSKEASVLHVTPLVSCLSLAVLSLKTKTPKITLKLTFHFSRFWKCLCSSSCRGFIKWNPNRAVRNEKPGSSLSCLQPIQNVERNEKCLSVTVWKGNKIIKIGEQEKLSFLHNQVVIMQQYYAENSFFHLHSTESKCLLAS